MLIYAEEGKERDIYKEQDVAVEFALNCPYEDYIPVYRGCKLYYLISKASFANAEKGTDEEKIYLAWKQAQDEAEESLIS